jgi:hypothetical protein
MAMTSLFEDGMALMSECFDTAFGERWLYQPRTDANNDVNDRKAADPARPAREIVGIFINGYARAFSIDARLQGVKPERPGHASARPQLDLDITQLPYLPRDGDRVIRHLTGAVYQVAEPKFPTAGPRQQLDLNQLQAGKRGA